MRYVRFITKEIPIRTPSIKSVIEKPEYSKYKKRPIRMPIAIDTIPTDNRVSSFKIIYLTLKQNYVEQIIKNLILNHWIDD
jgi:hypothetical protein